VPTIVTPTGRLANACTELWADPTDLLTQWDHAFDTATEEDAQLALAEATWLLWSLSGYRYHGVQCWSEDYRLAPGQPKLELAQWPVEHVFALSNLDMCAATGSDVVVTDWCHLGNGVLRLEPTSNFYTLPNPCGWSRIVRVVFRTTNNLPFGTERAVLTMADQFYRARVGSPCKLPERITSVTRQGVSWTVLDPMDFLTRGMTGIGSVDQWLAASNGRGPSQVIDPLIRSHRLSSTLIGCGEGCGP
jgi:hypothetical protein